MRQSVSDAGCIALHLEPGRHARMRLPAFSHNNGSPLGPGFWGLFACFCPRFQRTFKPFSQEARLLAALLSGVVNTVVDSGHTWFFLKRGPLDMLCRRFDWLCGLTNTHGTYGLHDVFQDLCRVLESDSVFPDMQNTHLSFEGVPHCVLCTQVQMTNRYSHLKSTLCIWVSYALCIVYCVLGAPL